MENLEVRFFKKDLVGFGLIYFVFTILCVVMFVIGYNFALSLIFAIFLFYYEHNGNPIHLFV